MATLPSVFMFSGQGSHYYQMAKNLYENHGVFRQQLLALDDLAKAQLGTSLVEQVYDPSRKVSDPFDQTRWTHPAIFMVEVAMAKVLMHEGIQPDYVLGASMGSFAAAAIAGCLDVEQAFTAVVKQAELLHECCEPGSMVAILDKPALFEQQPELNQHSVIGSVNFENHFVVSSKLSSKSSIIDFLKSRNITHQDLAVSHAFHSPWIDGAQEAYLDFLRTLNFRPPEVPMICTMEVNRVAHISEPYFWQVIRQPIRFRETVSFLQAQQSYHYIDLGPSGTLATFLKYILPRETSSKASALITPYGKEDKALETLVAQLA